MVVVLSLLLFSLVFVIVVKISLPFIIVLVVLAVAWSVFALLPTLVISRSLLVMSFFLLLSLLVFGPLYL